MTLVVARLLNNRIHIESDSRITDEGAVRTGYLEGALKAVIVHPALCVSFAGPVGAGQRSIADLGVNRDQSFDLDEVETSLLRAHRAHGPDFIVASLHPQPALSRIHHGQLECGSTDAWIGDQRAFAAYQRTFHSAPRVPAPGGLPKDKAEDLDVAARMSQAIRAAIDDPTIHTVDDLPIAVDIDQHGFRYAPTALLAASHEQAIPSGVPTTLEFGTAAQGGFGYTICPPAESGIGAVGVHFHQGQLGALFYPKVSPSAIVFRSVSHEAFERTVEREYGITLAGGMRIG